MSADGQHPVRARPRPGRDWLRLVLLALGLGLLIYLVRMVGLEALFANARRLGWTFLLLVLLYGGVHFLRAVSWRSCLREESRHLPLGVALRLWLCGEAVSGVSFSWSGEAFRAAATQDQIPFSRGLSALVVSRLLYSYSGLLVTTICFVAAFFLAPFVGGVRALTGLAAAAFLLLAILPLLGGGTLARLFGWLQARLRRRSASPVWSRACRFVETLDLDVAALYAQGNRMFAELTAVNLLAALVGVAEVYLILQALGVSADVVTALFIEGISKVLSAAAYFVPGNIGVREGAIVLVLRLFELEAALALTLVLVRRARSLVWIAVGSLLVALEGLTPLLYAELDRRPEKKPTTKNVTSARVG
jgi:uncharacterized protein (TIRG00374 family)